MIANVIDRLEKNVDHIGITCHLSPLIQIEPQSNSKIWDKVFKNKPSKIF